MAEKQTRVSGVSDKAVASATGKTWNEWVDFLDELGAAGLSHKDIVALTADPGGVANGWWQQSVAIGYEQARGKRVVGQTTGADFQVGVQKTLPVGQLEAWELLTRRPGRDCWLGCTADLEFRPGEKYQTAEGRNGEIRTCLEGQRIRLIWIDPSLAGPSTLQVTLAASGERTSVRFHQERLASLDERELMRDHWRRALDELQKLVSASDLGRQASA